MRGVLKFLGFSGFSGFLVEASRRRPSTRFGVAGDLVKLTEDAPGIEVIESNAFYHSDLDTPDIVPAAGRESITRAYAKIIDDINKLDLKDIVDAPTPSLNQR